MFGWFKPKKLVPDSPTRNDTQGGGIFAALSTHAGEQGVPNPYDGAADLLSALRAKSPQMQAVANGTMDSADLDGLGSDIKRAYTLDESNVSEALTMWYARQGFMGHQLAAIVAQHWLVLKACKMPADDAVRNWFDIVSADGDELDPKIGKLISRWDRKFNLRKNLKEFVTFGRIFGIRIVLFKVSSTDPEYYEKPFNPDGVTPGSYKGMVQVDPYWCAPLLDSNASANPDTKHFYEPTWWVINGQKYHRSHLCIYINGVVADILKPTYLYGGIPLPQMIMERVYAAERTANEGPQLAMNKRTTVFYTDVAKALANWKKFAENLNIWARFRDNFGVKVADKTDDKVEVSDTALGDLDSVIMTQYQIVAAIAGTPSTKLFGTSPKGFGASGDYEVESYHENLETIQDDMTPLVERHHLLVSRSIVIPKLGADANVETSPSWNPLDTLTATEQADVNLKKAQTGQALAGAIDQYDERERVRKDKNSGYSGIPEAERPETGPDMQPLSTPESAAQATANGAVQVAGEHAGGK